MQFNLVKLILLRPPKAGSSNSATGLTYISINKTSKWINRTSLYLFNFDFNISIPITSEFFN